MSMHVQTRPRLTRDDLRSALKAAGNAHHEYEINALGGVRDPHWAGWYAAYLLGCVGDVALPSDVADWLSKVDDSSDWFEAATRVLCRNLHLR